MTTARERREDATQTGFIERISHGVNVIVIMLAFIIVTLLTMIYLLIGNGI